MSHTEVISLPPTIGWCIVEDGVVTQPLGPTYHQVRKSDRSITPPSIEGMTVAERVSWGVYRLHGLPDPDQAYYTVQPAQYAIRDDLGVVVRTIPALPRPLPTLKSEAVASIKSQANNMLTGTDRAVLEALEAGVAVPVAVKTYRSAIRANAAASVTAINASTTNSVAKLKAAIAAFDTQVGALVVPAT
jgi:hypothetical protein